MSVLQAKKYSPDHVDKIGMLTLQRNAGEPNWYALNAQVDNNSPASFRAIARLLEILQKEGAEQPADIFKALDVIPYATFNQDWIPLDSHGKGFYKLMIGEKYYARIIAKDDKQAHRIAFRLKYPEGVIKRIYDIDLKSQLDNYKKLTEPK